MTRLGIMGFDTVEPHNLDRLVGATAMDALLGRSKIDVAQRLVANAATAIDFELITHDDNVVTPAGVQAALDYDVIISCVDRPWPRAVLNGIAYTDLIPVIDGGIAIDVFANGDGMRNAAWRSHVIRPGRPCMACNGQINLGEVAADSDGSLDDPVYFAGRGAPAGGQNVAALSVSVTAALLVQFVSFNVGPGGLGEPGPLRYLLSTNTLERVAAASAPHCPTECGVAEGDRRVKLSGEPKTEKAVNRKRPSLTELLLAITERGVRAANRWITHYARQRLAK